MKITLKQISSLEKVRDNTAFEAKEILKATALSGEEYSYQIVVGASKRVRVRAELISPIAEQIEVYYVRRAVMDYPCYPEPERLDDLYITKEPGLMPDILMPIEGQKHCFHVADIPESLWIRVKTKNIPAGTYPIIVKVASEPHVIEDYDKLAETEIKFELTVLEEKLPELATKFTQWFHTDCIASVHHVEIYSEAHWDLIDRYLALAADLGINMILTPVITPPLDTSIGLKRRCVQLAQIEKTGEKYTFDFSKLRRFIGLLDKNGIKYIEIMHLFSQWGLRSTPNILVRENGEDKYIFNWDVSGQSDEYRNFLKQFVPALVNFLKAEGVFERCYFHISDEPNVESLPRYEYGSKLIKPMLEGAPLMDALSHLEFYERGYTEYPVCSLGRIEPFLEKKLEGQWGYYCCTPHKNRTNRFMAQPSYRNRIIGLQMYKYNIQGFLHWGYNYYNEQGSRYPINPYMTTSSERAFPSGDAFSVYPDENYGAIPSLRAIVFKEALQDIEICRTLEKYIGKDAVISFIESEGGAPITLTDYPRSDDFIVDVIEKMKRKIAEFAAK